MKMHAIAGDEIVVEGRTVGRLRRRGEVLGVAGELGHERYRVRWDDGRESLFFPGPETRTIHIGELPEPAKPGEPTGTTEAGRRPASVRPSDPVIRIARYPVEAVDAGVPLRTVAETLAADDIGALVVLAPHAPAGVVSERDVVRFVAAGDDLDNSEAADAINSDLVCAGPDDSVAAVAAMMLDCQIRHVPILRDHTLVGMVSIRDVLQVFAEAAARAANDDGAGQ